MDTLLKPLLIKKLHILKTVKDIHVWDEPIDDTEKSEHRLMNVKLRKKKPNWILDKKGKLAGRNSNHGRKRIVPFRLVSFLFAK